MKYKWRFHFHLYLYQDSLHSQLCQMSCPLFSGGSNYASNSLCLAADMCRRDTQNSHSKPALSCFRFASFTTVCWHFLKQFFKQIVLFLDHLTMKKKALWFLEIWGNIQWHSVTSQKIRTFSKLAVRTSNLTKNAYTLSWLKWHAAPLKFWRAEVQWGFHL
jgi:hypothetical protein